MKIRHIIGFCLGILGTLLGVKTSIKYGQKMVEDNKKEEPENDT